MNIRQMLSRELELGHCEHLEQQIIILNILRLTCQQLNLASGQQERSEENALKIKERKKALVNLQVQLCIMMKA